MAYNCVCVCVRANCDRCESHWLVAIALYNLQRALDILCALISIFYICYDKIDSESRYIGLNMYPLLCSTQAIVYGGTRDISCYLLLTILKH